MKATDAGLILLLVLAAAVYLWGKKPRKPASTAQELVGYTYISPDGIVELPGRRFALVLEVQAVPLYLRSEAEQAAAWLAFRELLNSLTLPVTFLVQTRYVDLRGYLAQLAAAAGQAATPELMAYGWRLVAWLAGLAEGRVVRELRHYIIVRMDVSDLGDFASGVGVGNELVDAAVRKLARGPNLSDAEARDLARRELQNQAAVIIQHLSRIGVRCAPTCHDPASDRDANRPLNRQEVLDMIYSFFNRDMADVVTVRNADEMAAFSLTPYSETLDLFGEVLGSVPQEAAGPERAAGA